MRTVTGAGMIFLFAAITYSGHVYVLALLVILQSLVFREMVNVRCIAAKDKEIPLFCTLQWSWFAVAVFYSYGDFLHDFVQNNLELRWLVPLTRWHAGASFCMYSFCFIVSVLTLKKGLYRYQISQLTWTVVTICTIVAQLKFVAHSVFSGMFWFFVPCSLVVCNDIGAYVCGILFGRKFIKRQFFSISPNKTWEGFIGAIFFTMLFSYVLSGALSRYDWFICPAENITLEPHKLLVCEPDDVFLLKVTTILLFAQIFFKSHQHILLFCPFLPHQDIDILSHIPNSVPRFFKYFLLLDLKSYLGTLTLRIRMAQFHAVVIIHTYNTYPFSDYSISVYIW